LYTEWIFSIGLTPKKKGISFVPQELPPFLYGSNPIEKTAKPEGPSLHEKNSGSDKKPISGSFLF